MIRFREFHSIRRPRFKTCSSQEDPKKSNHVNGWCGPSQVQSQGYFHDLNVIQLWFLRAQVSPRR